MSSIDPTADLYTLLTHSVQSMALVAVFGIGGLACAYFVNKYIKASDIVNMCMLQNRFDDDFDQDDQNKNSKHQ